MKQAIEDFTVENIVMVEGGIAGEIEYKITFTASRHLTKQEVQRVVDVVLANASLEKK